MKETHIYLNAHQEEVPVLDKIFTAFFENERIFPIKGLDIAVDDNKKACLVSSVTQSSTVYTGFRNVFVVKSKVYTIKTGENEFTHDLVIRFYGDRGAVMLEWRILFPEGRDIIIWLKDNDKEIEKLVIHSGEQ